MTNMLEKMAEVMLPYMGDCNGGERALAIHAARAALQAIREPSKACEDAGDDAYDKWSRPDAPSSLIFRLMIDAILEGKA
jgi:hypothetical protein